MEEERSYKMKYLKYKTKYLELQAQNGGLNMLKRTFGTGFNESTGHTIEKVKNLINELNLTKNLEGKNINYKDIPTFDINLDAHIEKEQRDVNDKKKKLDERLNDKLEKFNFVKKNIKLCKYAMWSKEYTNTKCFDNESQPVQQSQQSQQSQQYPQSQQSQTSQTSQTVQQSQQSQQYQPESQRVSESQQYSQFQEYQQSKPVSQSRTSESSQRY